MAVNVAPDLSDAAKDDREFFTKQWQPYKAPSISADLQVSHVNCLILGKGGTGKSSFVNTCYWSVYPDRFPDDKPALTRDSIEGEHGTEKVQWCDVVPCLRLIDTKGLIEMVSEDEIGAVTMLIEGRSVDGKKMEKYEKQLFFWEKVFKTSNSFHDNVQKSTIQNMPHVVLMVVAANDKIPYSMEKILEIAGAQDPPLPVAWLITKSDSIAKDSVSLFKKSLLAQFRNRYPQPDDIDSLVFEIPNYTDKTTALSEQKNAQTLALMRTLNQQGIGFVIKKQKKLASQKGCFII